MWVTRAGTLRSTEVRERVRLEYEVLALQSIIAAFFCVGSISGAFGADGYPRDATVAWIAGYHLAHAVYVVRWRIPGRPIRSVESVTPLFDVTCITAGWTLIGDPGHPLWAAYLYALVGYARRYEGRRYEVLVAFIVVNLRSRRTAAAGDIRPHAHDCFHWLRLADRERACQRCPAPGR